MNIENLLSKYFIIESIKFKK